MDSTMHAGILIVDASPRLRGVLAERFAAQGFEVTTAADSSRAVEALRALPLQMLLVDVELPEIEQLAIIAALTRLSSPPSVYLVVAHEGQEHNSAIERLVPYRLLCKGQVLHPAFASALRRSLLPARPRASRSVAHET